MATYTLSEAPEVKVSVQGKDSPTTRQKAIDKIVEMSKSGDLVELPNGLSADQLILSEAPPHTTDLEDEDEEDPLVVAVRELNKFSPLKIKTQRLKQAALGSRRNIDVLFTEEPIEQDLDQLEETLKGSFKTLKEFAVALVEYRKAKLGAEKARIILDEALQLSFPAPSTSDSSANSLIETEVNSVENDAAEAEDEITTETARNGKKKRP